MNSSNHQRTIRNSCGLAVMFVVIVTIFSDLLVFGFYYGVGYLMPYLEKLISNLFVLMGNGRGIANIKAAEFVYGSEFSQLLSVIATILCFFVPYFLFFKGKRDATAFISLEGKISKSFPLICCAASVMASLWSIITDEFFSFAFPDIFYAVPYSHEEIYGVAQGEFAAVLAFIGSCILAPIAEEFVYRGLIFGYLRRFGLFFSAIASSVFFGLGHANPGQLIYAVVYGIVLCVVTEKTGNLKTAILVHFFNNLIAFSGEYIITDSLLFDIIYNLLLGVFAVMGIISMVSLRKKEHEEPALGISDYVREIDMRCFFNPGTILLILMFAYDIFSYYFLM